MKEFWKEIKKSFKEASPKRRAKLVVGIPLGLLLATLGVAGQKLEMKADEFLYSLGRWANK